jgi:hypothetical protein
LTFSTRAFAESRVEFRDLLFHAQREPASESLCRFLAPLRSAVLARTSPTVLVDALIVCHQITLSSLLKPCAKPEA